jgi:hypothetical protein
MTKFVRPENAGNENSHLVVLIRTDGSISETFTMQKPYQKDICAYAHQKKSSIFTLTITLGLTYSSHHL